MAETAFGKWAPCGRYSHQSKTLALPWSALAQFSDAFCASSSSSAAKIAPEIVYPSSLFTCSHCNWEGENVQQYRDHCSSEDHVTRLCGKVDEEESSDESDVSDDDLSALPGTRTFIWRRRLIDRVVYWERPEITDQYGIAICAALLEGDSDESLDRSMRALSDWEYWIVVCLRSGKFAGVVFNAKGDVVAHKSFHRYTVRAKAGGAQTTFDAQGKKAQSAGSSLRRYGAQRLEEEVTAIFETWKQYRVKGRVFASASSNCRPLLMKVAGTFTKIPFMASKVTMRQVECLFVQLRVLHMTLPVEKVVAPDVESEKVEQEEHPPEVKMEPAVLVYNEDEDPMFSALHRAARDGNIEDINYLLETHDPTALDGKGRVPYFLCGNAAREAFRKFCANHATLWDWQAARVEALTDEIQERQKQKAREKRKKLKERQKEAKLTKQEEEEARMRAQEEEEERRKGAPCSCCGKPSGEKPFYRFDYTYCSPNCSQRHARTLAADAACARFEK